MRTPNRTKQLVTRSVNLTATLAAMLGLIACGEDSKASNVDPASSGGSGGTTNTGSGGTTSTTTSTEPAAVGVFSVTLNPANASTGSSANAKMTGAVRTAAPPDPRSWTLQAEGNGCQLLIPATPLCNPKCVSGDTCVQGGTCVAAPTAKSVGTITVTGIKNAAGVAPFTIEPTSSSVYNVAGGLTFPPFAEGDSVSIDAAGGDYTAFTISTKGIGVIAGTPASLPIDKNTDAAVTWTAAGASANSTISIQLDISQHGGTKGKIDCLKVPDTGSLKIPATLITQLINLGVAGFPVMSIVRNAVGSATLAHGRVDLVLTSPIEVDVTIPGLTSCNDVIPCPTGKTCQADYTCL